MPESFFDDLDSTVRCLRAALLARRDATGVWRGRLSGSALATATAVFALARLDHERSELRINQGLAWLLRQQNADGGWGDTPESRSNISTTLLVWSALSLPAAEALPGHQAAVAGAEAWLIRVAGGLEPRQLAVAVQTRYAGDQTFAVPILTLCVLAGRLGDPAKAWPLIKPLPFELALIPHTILKWCRIRVVSYALPALIALGQVRFHLAPPQFFLTRLWRWCFVRPTLRKLERIQPASGGFLEAIPLTAFVCMSIGACRASCCGQGKTVLTTGSYQQNRSEIDGNSLKHTKTCAVLPLTGCQPGTEDQAVIRHGIKFLLQAARPDGSWPVDSDLATWVTTLSINALASAPDGLETLSADERNRLKTWLLEQQFRTVHPYTQAAPGGWSWTDLPGGVPDADDTAGALLALHLLAPEDPAVLPAVNAGVNWLLQLQNSDGGFPTFCRGWGKLPFDRSAPELTVHALWAMSVWQTRLPAPLTQQVTAARRRGLHFLRSSQRADGAWLPLWFGNQGAPGELNPVYGTARVVAGLGEIPATDPAEVTAMLTRGAQFLLTCQNPDGGWGGAAGVASSIEETAVVLEALAVCGLRNPELDAAIGRGWQWLLPQVREPDQITASPIGLYFARLWYAEELYPLIFALGAVQRVAEYRGI